MTRKNIMIFVMVILFLSGCAGEDTKLNEGTVHILLKGQEGIITPIDGFSDAFVDTLECGRYFGLKL